VNDGFKILFSGGKQAMKDMTKDKKEAAQKAGPEKTERHTGLRSTRVTTAGLLNFSKPFRKH